MPNGLFYLSSLDKFISIRRGVGLLLLLPCFIEILIFNTNSVEPDRTVRSVASDLRLHCLSMSL